MILETIGWLGAFFFATCAVPQAWQTYKDKHSHGLNWWFLIFWLLGEICMTIYVWPTGDLPLLTNYLVNLVLTTYIFYYKVHPRVRV